jgi:8-oxo-dGTP diphosphatase
MLTADIAVFQFAANPIKVLLIKRALGPYKNCWALPGGFVDMKETLEQSAARELEEETGLVGLDLVQVHTYGDPDRDPRGRTVTVAYAATADEKTELSVHSGSDAADARWFPITQLPDLAFDHQQIIQDAYSMIKDHDK